MDMLACTPVEFSFLETLTKVFIIHARQNQFFQKNFQNKALVRRIAIAMNADSAFTGSYTENPFWYQQFDLRQLRKLRRGQSMVDFLAADNCRLYVSTMELNNLPDDIPSIQIDYFRNHYELVFDVISMSGATENCHHPALVRKLLRLELNVTHPLEYASELNVLEEGMSSVAVDKFGVVGKNINR